MYKSLRSIADEIGVTKTAVYQHYIRLKRSRGTELSKHVIGNGKILLDNFTRNLVVNSFRKRNKNTNQMLIRSYEARIKNLEQELHDKNKNIKSLQHLLEQSQSLQKDLTKKLERKSEGFWQRLRK